ncbi:TRAF3-interacting protein 1-like [Brassica napus]|uniref:TRAF3-interacting protein 1-like n=1 Tax=Brassica napus TaxID=3708 RepID=UPI0020799873|nr:TRAF3-interacting protein 1-like [Brassica napus]
MKPAKYYQGLLPLLKNYMLELAKGVEISATLVYEKLEKHCKRCLRLDHEEEDCPELRKEREERTQEAKQNFSPPRAEIGTKAPARVGSAEEKGRLERSRNYSHNDGKERYLDRGQRTERTWDSDRLSRDSLRRREQDSFHSRPYQVGNRREERWVETGRRIQTSSRSKERENSRFDRSPSHRRLRDEERSPQISSRHRESQISTGSHRVEGERADNLSAPHDAIPAEVMAEAREELREVLIQYTSCADPSESATRKERLRRAEEQGEVDESAEQIARQLMRDQEAPQMPSNQIQVAARVPASQRLGGGSSIETPLDGLNDQLRVSAKKRLGRPPNKENLG